MEGAVQTLPVLGGCGGGESTQGTSTESVLRNDYTMPGRIGILIAVETGELEQTFIGLGSAVAKENFARANLLTSLFASLTCSGIEKRLEQGQVRLPGGYLLNPMGMAMPEVAYRNAGGEVEVFPALRIPHLGSLAADHFNCRSGVIGNEILTMLWRNHQKSGRVNNFGTDTFVGENFEQNTVR